MDPGTPVEVVCDQAVAALAAIIKPSQQSESLVKVSDIAAKTAALGPQVWEAATTGSSAAYCKQLLERDIAAQSTLAPYALSWPALLRQPAGGIFLPVASQAYFQREGV